MKIFIITVGSRGDVQPYVALGRGLMKAGHAVTVCAVSTFKPFIIENGLEYGYMNDGFMKLIDTDAGREAMGGSQSPISSIKNMLSLLKESKSLFRTMFEDAWKAAQQAAPDVIIYHPKSLIAPHLAEKLGIPAIMALTVPIVVPTSEAPALGLPDLKLGGGYNRFTYSIMHKGFHTYDDVINEFRQRVLGLGKIHGNASPIVDGNGKSITVLHAFSSQLSPRPSDWPETAHITGFWFLDEEAGWQPSRELQAFLDGGMPPVYIGFGSMAGRDAEHKAKVVVEALQKANLRGVIATGWGGLDADRLPDSILKIDKAPHSWLFPRVSAVVHHGGAGTTAAGLLAGRPAIICPFFADQPYWGARVHALGAGSKPIPQKKLTAENLSAALLEVTKNESYRNNAGQIGERLRAENGIANAVAIIEDVLQWR